MKITLEIPSPMEAQLREYMATRDPAEVQREVDAAFAGALLLVLAKDQPPMSLADYDALLAEHDAREVYVEDGPAMHPDETFSRETIYGSTPK